MGYSRFEMINYPGRVNLQRVAETGNWSYSEWVINHFNTQLLVDKRQN